MAADEQIVSPDQRKPTSRKAMYAALLFGAGVILSYLVGNNHVGRVEDVFVVISAAVLIGVVVVDAWMRKTGLR